MRIIGITGKNGVGKNTLGGLIAGSLVNLGYNVAMDSFAQPIKKALVRAHRMWKGGKEERIGYEKTGMTAREFMEQRGDVRPDKNPSCFVEDMRERARGYDESDVDFLVIPDVRYGNEMAWVTDSDHSGNSEFGCLVRLTREGSVDAKTDGYLQAIDGFAHVLVEGILFSGYHEVAKKIALAMHLKSYKDAGMEPLARHPEVWSWA